MDLLSQSLRDIKAHKQFMDQNAKLALILDSFSIKNLPAYMISKVCNISLGTHSELYKNLKIRAFVEMGNKKFYRIFSNDWYILVLLSKFLKKKGALFDITRDISSHICNCTVVKSIQIEIEVPMIGNSSFFKSQIEILSEFFDLLKRLRIEEQKYLLCSHCGVSSTAFFYPYICSSSLTKIISDSVKAFADSPTRDFKFTFSRSDENHSINFIYKILAGLKPFTADDQVSDICSICSRVIGDNTSWLSGRLCNDCSQNIDWKSFQVAYENGYSDWDSFLESDHKYFSREKT